VIAEGVESVQEFQALHDMGVPFAQGFYFAPPAALVDPVPLDLGEGFAGRAGIDLKAKTG
jgi:EAL domain-containing protein (putative c-di-GMP-specific phosphodiesterase class I)